MIQSFVKCFNPYFNSIKVRLEPLDATQDQVEDGDFNSIKVRLELYTCEPMITNNTISIP